MIKVNWAIRLACATKDFCGITIKHGTDFMIV